MAIGRYRDVPDEMEDLEREVAAAQYPEGGLVVGLGAGILLPLLLAEILLLVVPLLGGMLGFALGRQLRDYKIRRRRADRHTGDEQPP